MRIPCHPLNGSFFGKRIVEKLLKMLDPIKGNEDKALESCCTALTL
tara:strand:+ start:2072 stop:2209 length:138 start_codon:yes stop_codon:yes gene_type:complete